MEGQVHIVMGGQAGSEGKGEVVAYLAEHHDYHHIVRTGGPNAGHTVTSPEYGTHKMRQIPVAWATQAEHPLTLYIGPGSLINEAVLAEEYATMKREREAHGRRVPEVVVDGKAIIIDQRHIDAEAGMRESIGGNLAHLVNAVFRAGNGVTGIGTAGAYDVLVVVMFGKIGNDFAFALTPGLAAHYDVYLSLHCILPEMVYHHYTTRGVTLSVTPRVWFSPGRSGRVPRRDARECWLSPVRKPPLQG